MRKINLFLALMAFTFASSAQSLDKEGQLFNVAKTDGTFNITTTLSDHYYPDAGIKITTGDAEIVSGCRMIGNGYCLFAVSDEEPAVITFSGSGRNFAYNLCLDGKGPLSCQKFSYEKKLYVTNMSDDGTQAIEVCTLQSDGSLNTCIPAGNTVNHFDGPGSISINANNTLAYVVNYLGSSISVCPINSDGTFADCIQNLSFDFSYGGSAISPDGETLFVTNYCTETVDACSIQMDGTLGGCEDTGAGSSIDTELPPYGIILNKAGTIAYVANLGAVDNEVAVCTIDDNSFSCSNSGGAFANPVGLAFSADESQVYVTDTMLDLPYISPSISVCDVGDGGTLSCLDSGYGNNDESAPWGILIDGANAQAYVSDNEDGFISLCGISSNPSNKGQFTSCIDSGLGASFDGPAFMSFSN